MRSLCTVGLGLLLCLAACGGPSEGNATEDAPAAVVDPNAAAEAAANGVATITERGQGTGTPVYIFPEDHGSIRGQIEQAVVLERLRSAAGLRRIVLEGMLPEDRQDAPTGISAEAALALLREGDISAAEFMALVHRLELHPGDDQGSYASEAADVGQACDAIVRLAAIEQLRGTAGTDAEGIASRLQSAGQDFATRSQDDLARLQAIGETNDTALVCERDQLARRLLNARAQAFAGFLEGSPTAARAYQQMCAIPDESDAAASRIRSIEDEAAVLRDVQRLAEGLPEGAGDVLAPLAAQQAFLEARSRSSDLMVASARQLASGNGAPIGMIIGAAHTARVVELMRQSGLPFFVIQVNALGNPESDVRLTGAAYRRKSERLPAQGTLLNRYLAASNEGLYDTAECDSNAIRKPRMVIHQPWLERKATLYELMRNYSTEALRVGGAFPPPGAWSSPFGQIDAARSVRDVDADGNPYVLFPILIAAEPQPREVWVRVARVTPLAAETSTPIQRGNIEQMLLGALRRHDEPGGRRPPGDGARRGGRDQGSRMLLTLEIEARTFRSVDEARQFRALQVQ